MINIADNQVVREQVMRISFDSATQNDSVAQSKLPLVAPAYPAKSMVLDGGRYYASEKEK